MPSIGTGVRDAVAVIGGIPAIGATLNATLGKGWTATGFQWTRNGAPIQGANQQQYICTDSDNGALISCGISGLVFTATGLKLPTVFIYPTPINNEYVVFGDSRTALNTETYAGMESHVVVREMAVGYGAWSQISCDYRGNWTGAYGINTARISNLIARLHGSGSLADFKGTSPLDPERGYLLDGGAGLTAGTVVVLIGVNGGDPDTIGQTGDSDGRTKKVQYDDLFMQLVDAGKVVLICNEIPAWYNTNSQNIHYDLHTYLDEWPYSSPTMSDVQKATYAGRVVIVNTYDLLGDPINPKAPNIAHYGVGDELHPNTSGNRLIGEAIGYHLNNMYAKAGFPVGYTLPDNPSPRLIAAHSLTGSSTAISTTNSETAGTGGANMDGRGGLSIIGNRPTGILIKRHFANLLNGTQDVNSVNYFNATVSIITNSDGSQALQIDVDGFLPNTSTSHILSVYANPKYLNQSEFVATGLVDGDKLYSIAKLNLADNHLGVTGFGITQKASFVGSSDTGYCSMIAPSYNTSRPLDATPDGFDRVVKTKSRTIPNGSLAASGTTTFDGNITINFAGNTEISASFIISNWAMLKE